MFFGVGTVATLDGLGHEWLGLIAGWTIAGLILGATQASAATIGGWASAAALYARVAELGGPIARAPGMRWLIGGLAVDGNIELAITALTFAAYGVLTGAVMARLTRPAGVAGETAR
jgi:hypothetical protein